MAEQLVFDLPVREARGREDFFVSPANAEALAAIEAWESWPQGKLLLKGPAGSGKTHLAHVWVAMAGAALTEANRITVGDVPELARHRAVVAENADAKDIDEVALLHLHNLLSQRKGALLITAKRPSQDWGLSLPDLASRLASAPVAQLASPDDALLRAVLLKQFSDRQLIVSPEVIAWLIPRMDRSFDFAKNVVEELDTASLSEGRSITRKLAARVLDIDAGGGA